MAALPFPQADLLALRRDLVRLQRLAQAQQGADPLHAHDLRTVEALADCLARFLVDGALILVLTADPRPPTGAPAPTDSPSADADWAATTPPYADADIPAVAPDPDWDSWDPRAAAPLPDTKQTDAQRSLIYGLCAAINMHPAYVVSWLHSRFAPDIDCIEQLTHAQSVTAIADRQAKLARGGAPSATGVASTTKER